MIRSLLAVLGSGMLGVALGLGPVVEQDASIKYVFRVGVTNFEWFNPTPETIAVSGRFTIGDSHSRDAVYSRSVEVIGADGEVLDRKDLGIIEVKAGTSRVHYPFDELLLSAPGEHAVRATLMQGDRIVAQAQRRCTKD